jgi:hypothetical protein
MHLSDARVVLAVTPEGRPYAAYVGYDDAEADKIEKTLELEAKVTECSRIAFQPIFIRHPIQWAKDRADEADRQKRNATASDALTFRLAQEKEAMAKKLIAEAHSLRAQAVGKPVAPPIPATPKKTPSATDD